MDEQKVLDEVQRILGDEFNPLICRARNAIALQQLANKQIKRTIKDNGNVIIKRETQKMLTYINHANNAMESLTRHLFKGNDNALNDLLDALRTSIEKPKEEEDASDE